MYSDCRIAELTKYLELSTACKVKNPSNYQLLSYRAIYFRLFQVEITLLKLSDVRDALILKGSLDLIPLK